MYLKYTSSLSGSHALVYFPWNRPARWCLKRKTPARPIRLGHLWGRERWVGLAQPKASAAQQNKAFGGNKTSHSQNSFESRNKAGG